MHTDTPTLELMRQEQASQLRRLELMIRFLGRVPSTRIRKAIQACTTPLSRDAALPFSAQTITNTQNFEKALRENRYVEAMKLRQLDPSRRRSGRVEWVLGRMMSTYATAEGLREVIGWLEDFEAIVARGNPEAVIEYLTMLTAEHPGICQECQNTTSWSDSNDWREYPALLWLHQNHCVVNQAAWEIMASQPNLIKRVRKALMQCLAAPSEFIGDSDVAFGNQIAKPYAQLLLQGFVRAQPEHEWVSTKLVPVAI